jgi:RNA polymerase sigma factor (sigma-70 family)
VALILSSAFLGGRQRPSTQKVGAMYDLSATPDCELMSAVILRNQDAFTEIFKRYSNSVRLASGTILGRSTACDDVVAEVFITLWLSPERFDPMRGPLLAFLRVKARGRSIDLLRSTMARARREANDGTRHHLERPMDSEMATIDLVTDMDRALSSLSAIERQPIDLAFRLGMSYRAVATHLGIPEGTAKARIRVGLKHLRQHIDPDGHLREERSDTHDESEIA